jgi:hypothetical protein
LALRFIFFIPQMRRAFFKKSKSGLSLYKQKDSVAQIEQQVCNGENNVGKNAKQVGMHAICHLLSFWIFEKLFLSVAPPFATRPLLRKNLSVATLRPKPPLLKKRAFRHCPARAKTHRGSPSCAKPAPFAPVTARTKNARSADYA